MAWVSGQSVAQFAFPQTLYAHSCPARRQLCLGTLKVCANFWLADAVKTGTAHHLLLPKAHYPARGNKGYKLLGTGSWPLLPSVDPQVFLYCLHQPIHGEYPMFIQSHTLSSRVHLAVFHWGWLSRIHGGRNCTHLISSPACPSEKESLKSRSGHQPLL